MQKGDLSPVMRNNRRQVRQCDINVNVRNTQHFPDMQFGWIIAANSHRQDRGDTCDIAHLGEYMSIQSV